MYGTYGTARRHRDRIACSGSCDSEVCDLGDPVSAYKYVLGLDILVDNAVLMCVLKSHSYLDNDRHGNLPVEMSVLIDKVLNRNTVNVFLNDISEVALVSYAEDLNYIGVIQ